MTNKVFIFSRIRIENLNNINLVEKIIPLEREDYAKAIRLIRPSVLLLGDAHKNSKEYYISECIRAIKDNKGSLLYHEGNNIGDGDDLLERAEKLKARNIFQLQRSLRVDCLRDKLNKTIRD